MKKSLEDSIAKPNLSENEVRTLERFAESGSNDLVVVKNIVAYYLDDLRDVMKIDAKENLGLHTLSRQQAYNTLVGIFKMISPDIEEHIQKLETKKKISQWQ